MSKFVVFCFLLYLGCVYGKSNVTLAPEKLAKLTKDALQCLSETGADPALLIQIREKTYTDDENVKKFLLCSFKKTGVASKKGVLKVDKLLEFYPDTVDKETLKKVVLECQQENGEPMDKIYNFFKCYQDKTPVRLTLSRN